MAKTRLIIVASVVIIIVTIFVLYVTILLKPTANVLIKFSLHPSDVYYSSYYFVLYDDATLKCLSGERGTDDIQADKFMYKIRKSAKTKLPEKEFKALIMLADELIACGFTSSGWECNEWYYVTLLYNGMVYKEIYQHYKSEELEKLSEELISLSPMEIELGY
jgi:hypothetical protein